MQLSPTSNFIPEAASSNFIPEPDDDFDDRTELAGQNFEPESAPAESDAATEEDLALPFWQPLLASVRLTEMPGWGASVGVHLLVLLALWGVRISTARDEDPAVISTLENQERPHEFETAITDQVATSAEVTTMSSIAGATAATEAGTSRVQAQMEQQIDEELRGPDISVSDEMPAPSDREIVSAVQIRGTGTENIGSAEGAIDRLSMEIAGSLRQKKTMVVWLFDASLSLNKRRNMIADRFENVYRQLGALDVNADKYLKTAVATYGKSFSVLTEEPVDDVRTIIPKIRTIPADESGKEFVFAAVGAVVKKFQKYSAGRNTMIIIVTDERGDDPNIMEDVIHSCRRFGLKCYVVGNAALFGREHGYVTWEYPDKTTEELPVDQGPETIMPEGLALGFWGGRGPDLTRMSSGYGPYALTRLCKETGGLYFIAEEGNGPRFNPAVMRNYEPDYRPIRDYEAALKKNKAKAALVTAATKTKLENVPLPLLEFRADNDNILRQGVTEAQKPAADLDYRLVEMYNILVSGEKDRPKITEPRWRASYDLAMGRVLAMRVRVFGYNKLLAEMKSSPKTFEKKESNQWRLVPSKAINSGADVAKMAKSASMYLKRVMDENPETPWAMLAERELSQPMGWDWQEASTGDSMKGLGKAAAEKKRILLAEEEKKRKEAAKKNMGPPRVRPNL